ncbi:DUF2683 family protein [Galbibacter sp.]
MVLKDPFETSEGSTYNTESVAEIKESEKQMKEGKKN